MSRCLSKTRDLRTTCPKSPLGQQGRVWGLPWLGIWTPVLARENPSLIDQVSAGEDSGHDVADWGSHGNFCDEQSCTGLSNLTKHPAHMEHKCLWNEAKL